MLDPTQIQLFAKMAGMWIKNPFLQNIFDSSIIGGGGGGRGEHSYSYSVSNFKLKNDFRPIIIFRCGKSGGRGPGCIF